MRFASGLVLACVVLWSERGVAQVEPVRFTYRADARCPDGGRFLSEVFARTNRVRPAADGEAARTLTVTITADSGHFKGLVEATALDGSISRREVSANDCEETVGALALVVAMTIDPEPAAESPAPAPPASAPDEPLPRPDPPVAPPGPAGESERSEAAASAVPEHPPDAALTRWMLGADGQSILGPLPAPAFGGGAFAEIASGTGKLRPSVRVSAFGAAATLTFREGIGAQVLWIAGRVYGCPAGFPLTRALRLDACATFEAGLLRTRGEGLDHNAETDNPWFSAGAVGRLAWVAHGGLEVEVAGGLAVPLRRYTFESTDDSGVSAIYRMPLVAGTASVGLGYRFP